MKKRRHRRKFTGPLAKPIEDKQNDFGAVFKQQMEKLPLLFEHYKIVGDNAGKYRFLAHALACEIVPGFKVKRSRGKPRTRASELVSLFIAVNALREKKPGRKVRTAIGILCRKPGSPWRGRDIDVLDNTYRAAKDDPRLAWIFREEV